jgi:hypothetical protein
MRGPAARWKFDVRRVWECPACGRREHTGGEIVSRSCDCQMNNDPLRPTWMRLVEEQGKRPLPPLEVGPQEPLAGADPPQ